MRANPLARETRTAFILGYREYFPVGLEFGSEVLSSHDLSDVQKFISEMVRPANSFERSMIEEALISAGIRPTPETIKGYIQGGELGMLVGMLKGAGIEIER